MRVESYIQGSVRCNLDREGEAHGKGVIRPKPTLATHKETFL